MTQNVFLATHWENWEVECFEYEKYICWCRVIELCMLLTVQVASYEFTTLTCVPGVIKYRGSKIQVWK
jgi:hypothetical protein